MNDADRIELERHLQRTDLNSPREVAEFLRDLVEYAYESGYRDGFVKGHKVGFEEGWEQAMSWAPDMMPDATDEQREWLREQAKDPGIPDEFDADDLDLPDYCERDMVMPCG